MKFRFDLSSFLIGVAVTTVVWWLIYAFRLFFGRWLEDWRIDHQDADLRNRRGLEGTYLAAVYKYTQGLHLAASLFPLDDIAITPCLLAPPPIPDPKTPAPHRDIIEQTLPYLPDYPEAGVFYEAPTLSLLQAISGGVQLAIIGQPGTGKSTALAYLAAQLSNPQNPPEAAQPYVPFLIQAGCLVSVLTDLGTARDVLTPVIEALTLKIKIPVGPKFHKFAYFNFKNGRALLLVDGMDELPQPAVIQISNYLAALLQEYPEAHVILTACPDFLDGLSAMGFSSMALMPWNAGQQAIFLTKWADLWKHYLGRESWAQKPGYQVDSLLLNRWLAVENSTLSPLEFTLKVWGAYAGDLHSGSAVEAIQAHINRIAPAGISRELSASLALQAILNELPVFDSRQAAEWIQTESMVAKNPALDSPVAPSPSATLPQASEPADSKGASLEPKTRPARAEIQAQQLSKISIISELTLAGLITPLGNGRLQFSHPVFHYLLAGQGLTAQPEKSADLLGQKTWSGQSGTLRYLAAFGDVSEIVKKLVTREDPILRRPQLAAGRLLRDSNLPPNTNWRTEVISALVKILQDESEPLGLRASALVTLVYSGDNKISALFRQLLLSDSDQMKHLAALGSGMTRDARALDTLANLSTNSLESTRQAACVALVGLGTSQALEEVALFLLHGDEQLRIFAAEALANNHEEGHEALSEGLDSGDILVRRAIIHGLARVKEPWATKLIEKSQVEDQQWMVRNLAVEFLNSRSGPDPHIPRKLPAPHENPWLIEFAGKFGMGVTPNQPATNIFLQALEDPNREYFKPALNYLRRLPSSEIYPVLLNQYYKNDAEIKEVVYETLVDIARNGEVLPAPQVAQI